MLGTSTPDHTFPATATKVQANLGMVRGAAFDLQAVCSGFVYALAVADNFIKAGQAQSALVIGAETFSRILDWDDRGTCVLFGDGAGAVLLQAGEEGDRGRALHAPLFRRPAVQAPLCGWRPVLDGHRRAICACMGVRCSATPS